MNIELRPLAEIKPYEKNPGHNDAVVDAVAESSRRFGFRQPIVVDADGVIVVGDTRWKAAAKLGLDKVPVHVARELTPEQAKAYRIADNKIADLATWDLELLPGELAELQALDVDLSLLGFGEDELAELLDPGVKQGLTDPDAKASCGLGVHFAAAMVNGFVLRVQFFRRVSCDGTRQRRRSSARTRGIVEYRFSNEQPRHGGKSQNGKTPKCRHAEAVVRLALIWLRYPLYESVTPCFAWSWSFVTGFVWYGRFFARRPLHDCRGTAAARGLGAGLSFIEITSRVIGGGRVIQRSRGIGNAELSKGKAGMRVPGFKSSRVPEFEGSRVSGGEDTEVGGNDGTGGSREFELGHQRVSEIPWGGDRAMKSVVKVKQHRAVLRVFAERGPGDKVGEVRDDIVNAVRAEKAERPGALKEGSPLGAPVSPPHPA